MEEKGVRSLVYRGCHLFQGKQESCNSLEVVDICSKINNIDWEKVFRGLLFFVFFWGGGQWNCCGWCGRGSACKSSRDCLTNVLNAPVKTSFALSPLPSLAPERLCQSHQKRRCSHYKTHHCSISTAAVTLGRKVQWRTRSSCFILFIFPLFSAKDEPPSHYPHLFLDTGLPVSF